MQSISSTPVGESTTVDDIHNHHHHHGLAWGAIIGGTLLAMAITLILVLLGSALELSSISPWSPPSATPISSFTSKAAIWLIIVQWLSSGLGGYLTGRVRCKWHGLHNDEVFFRDTANGIVTWALATVLMAALFAGSASSIIGGGVKAASTVTAGASMGAAHNAGNNASEPSGYYVDSLLRGNIAANVQDQRAEVTRILAQGLKTGSVPDSDRTYLAQIVSARSGLKQADAQKRVDDTIAQINTAKDKAIEDAEQARKVTLKVTFFLVLSMLIGAFIAGAAAAIGGNQRDEY